MVVEDRRRRHGTPLAIRVIGRAAASRQLPARGGGLWLLVGPGGLTIVVRHSVKLLLFYATATAYFPRARTDTPDTAPAAVVWPVAPAADASVDTDPVPR